MKEGEKDKIDVLLISEGTYPFYGGGVSTWSHMLCERVSNVNWYLYSINAGYESKPIFDLGPNVKEVIQIPLWAPDEPQDYESYTMEYYKVVDRKANTTSEIVENEFIPVFNQFLTLICDEDATGKMYDEVFYGLWNYFQSYDYKETFQHELVWEAFNKMETVYLEYIEQNPKDESTKAFVSTSGMTSARWRGAHWLPNNSIGIPPYNRFKKDLIRISDISKQTFKSI